MNNDNHDGPPGEHDRTIDYPPDPSVLTDAFSDALSDADSFEDARWIVWLYDALEDEDWGNVQWRGFVLNQKGHTGLIRKVDAYYGRWLSDDE